MKHLFLKLFLALQLLTLSALAAAPALSKKHQVSLDDFKGAPFLVAMRDQTKGIKLKIDSDYVDVYRVADWKTVESALYHFDSKIVRKVLGSFPDGIKGFERLTNSLTGREFRPSQAYELVAGRLRPGADIYAVSQVIAMGSGAGSLVILDQNNYYYNFGYKSGDNPSEDVKSGRSFAAGPNHNANDVSDVYYLNELERYLQETADLRPFYEAILKILLQSDASGLAKLSPLGQTVVTDFLAVYTAESDRHLMVDLNPYRHPWENDLAEVTFVSAFAATVRKVMKDGSLKPGRAREWWAMSDLGNGRSGIGETRGDRRKLQRSIGRYVSQKYPALMNQIESFIGKGSDRDPYRSLMEFINHYKTQDRVSLNANALIATYVELLALTRAEAPLIEARIRSQEKR